VEQLSLVSIFEQSERALWANMNAYAKRYARKYRGYGNRMGRKALSSEFEIRRRFAFAILSANAPWQESVEALRFAESFGFDIPDSALDSFASFQMVPAKAEYLRLLPKGKAIRGLLRGVGESWQEYRERLVKEVKGLGRCKASFSALLLYPTKSPLACIDTWVLKVYCGFTSFKSLGRKDYEAIESKIQAFGLRHGLNGALAQWVIWNAARGDDPSSAESQHDIFPSNHKSESEVPF
jgi:thermostable 8-oxoguanine DNA glycosylase